MAMSLQPMHPPVRFGTVTCICVSLRLSVLHVKVCLCSACEFRDGCRQVHVSAVGCANACLHARPHAAVPITQGGHGWQADIWSLGCTVMEMLTAMPPFQHMARSCLSVMRFIVDPNREVRVPDSLSQLVSEFVLAMLKRDPQQRGTARSFLRHPYLRDVVDRSKLSVDPVSHVAVQIERHETRSPTLRSSEPSANERKKRITMCDAQEKMARAQQADRKQEATRQQKQQEEVCRAARGFFQLPSQQSRWLPCCLRWEAVEAIPHGSSACLLPV